jgi:hypothetical protein
MTTLSLAERRERIGRLDRADRDGEDTVYVVESERDWEIATYHETEECRQLSLSVNPICEWTRQEAHRRVVAPCKWCALDEVEDSSVKGGGGPESCTCPFCGREVNHLAGHLPCDGAAREGGERP